MKVVVLVWVLGAGVASAQAGETVEAYASKGFEAAKEGRYREAVTLYLRGYELSPLSSILFNVAVIYDRRLREPQVAMDYYRRYLAAPDVDRELAKRASVRIEQMTEVARPAVELLAEKSAEPAPVVAPAPAAQPMVSVPQVETIPLGKRPGFWGALGLGVVSVGAIAAGLTFGLSAWRLRDDANRVCGPVTCPTIQGVQATQQALTAANLANGLVIGGVAVGVGALIWGLLTPSTSTTATLTTSVVPNATGGTFVLGGTY